MKYEYKHATGTTEIEVDEHFYELLVAMDNSMVADALDGKLDLIVTNAVITKGQFCKGSNRPCTAVSSLCIFMFESRQRCYITTTL